MAIGSGQDEVSTIHVRGVSEGIQDVIKDLRSLGQQLVSVDKQLSKSINTEKLKKDLSDITNEFTKIASSAAKGTAPAGGSVDSLTAKVRTLQKELKNVQKTSAVGLQTGAKPADVKAYKDVMEAVGTPVTGNPSSFAMLRKNMRNFRRDLDDTSRSGIASRDSLRAVTGEGGIAFMEPATKAEKFNATLRVLQGNLQGLSQQMTNQAKNTQWMGRQMLEGITLPIVGLGTMAVRSFSAVSSEMIQLKKVTEFSADYDKLEKSIRGTSREFGVSRKSATALFKDVAALGVEGEANISAFANAVSEIAMVGETDTSTALNFFRTMNAVFAGGDTTQKGLKDTTELMAQMSAVADETSLQLSDLAQAFPEVAPVMKNMGFSAGGTAAALAGMYKAGIPASEAAHALKFSLQRLVNPTKSSAALIDEIGFSLFDAAGGAKKSDMEIMALGKSLAGMNDEAQSKALGNLFGNRQTARMQTFFTDVERGRQELQSLNTGAATLDGRIITDATQLTSDYARGLVASGMAAGAAVSPMERYNKAAEEIKKDPSVALKRMRAAFDDIKIQLGAAITPAFLVLGDKLVKLLDTFMKSPKSFQLMILGFAGILAAIGPIIYIFAQAKHAVSAFTRVASFVLPKMGTITPEVAAGLMPKGSRGFLGMGDKVVPLLRGKEKRKLKRGALTDLEKTAEQERKTPEIVTESLVTKELSAANELLAQTEKNLAVATQASVVAIEEKTIAIGKASAAETAAATKSAAASKTSAATSAVTDAVNPKAGLGPFAAYGEAAEAGAAVEAAKVNKAAGLGPAMTGKSPHLEKNIDQFQELGRKAKHLAWLEKQREATTAAMPKKIDLSVGPFERLTNVVQRLNDAEKARLATLPPPPNPKTAINYKKIGENAKGAATGVGRFLTGSMQIEKAGAAGGLGKIINLFMKFNWISLLISVVIGLVLTLVVAFKGLGSNWDKIRKQIEPSLKKVGEAFNKVKEAISGIVEKMKGVFSQLGTGASGAEEAGSTIGGVGDIISMALDGVAKAIEFVAAIIPKLWPFFERTAYIVKNVVGLIYSLFTTDFSQAFQFALAIVYEFVRPALMLLQQFAQKAIGWMGPVMGALAGALETISFGALDDPLGLRTLEDDLDAFGRNAGWIDSLDATYRQGLSGIFGAGTKDAAEEAKPDAVDAGRTLGDGVNEGLAASSNAPEWAQDWAAQVMSALEKKIGEIKKSATDALEASHKIAMKIFDDRVKAITDQEKAEEKLYKTEEYLNKKKEIMQKRQLDNANYAKNRLLAIYEGRFNDVRTMDLEQQVNGADSNKQMGELEKSRGRDLIAEHRDNLKEQINAEKDAAEEIYQTRKTSIEAQIDLITQYTPATVEGVQTMMDQLNTVLLDNGVDSWPGKTQTAMDIMKEVFLTANKNVVQEFIASGKSQMTDWMAAFAEPVTVTILMKKSEASDVPGDGSMGDIGGGAGAKSLPANFGADIVQASKDFLKGNMTEGGKRMNDIFQGLLAKGDQKAIDKFLRDAETLAGAPKGVTPMPTAEEQRASQEAQTAKGMTPSGPPSALANIGVGAGAGALTGAVIGSVVPVIGTGVGAALGGLIGGVGGLMKSLFESTGKKSAKDIVKELRDKNVEITPNLIEEFKKRGYDITEEVQKTAEATGAAWNGAGEKVDSVFTGVQSNYRTAAAGIASDTVVYTDDLGNTWTQTTTGLVNQFGQTGSAIKNESGEMTGIMNFNTGQVSEKFTQTTAGMQQDMITAASVINGTDFSGAKSSTDGIGSNFLGMIFGPIGLLASWAGFSNVLSTPIKFATNIFSGLWTMFSSVMGDIWTSIKNVPVLGSLASGIESGVKAIGGAIGGVFGLATGGYVKAKPGGSLVNIAEGGFDEFVISTDPKYRASNMAYLASAASKMGMSSALGVASRGASRMTSGSMDMKSYNAAESASGGDTYISVDTFIGEEEWFASMASKYNMKTVPRERKVAGQQKRVISSYNDRYSIK
jgi:TP901 family phage tail tape measure protein